MHQMVLVFAYGRKDRPSLCHQAAKHSLECSFTCFSQSFLRACIKWSWYSRMEGRTDLPFVTRQPSTRLSVLLHVLVRAFCGHASNGLGIRVWKEGQTFPLSPG